MCLFLRQKKKSVDVSTRARHRARRVRRRKNDVTQTHPSFSNDTRFRSDRTATSGEERDVSTGAATSKSPNAKLFVSSPPPPLPPPPPCPAPAKPGLELTRMRCLSSELASDSSGHENGHARHFDWHALHAQFGSPSTR
jgi:hypothetical protein